MFEQTYSDTESAQILAGTKNATIKIDFSELMAADSNDGSKYIVGGRTYFEVSMFSTDYSSFTTKGFFDQLGYEEPTANTLSNNKGLLWLTIIGSILGFAGLVALIYCCYCKKQSNVEED